MKHSQLFLGAFKTYTGHTNTIIQCNVALLVLILSYPYRNGQVFSTIFSGFQFYENFLFLDVAPSTIIYKILLNDPRKVQTNSADC